MHHSKLAKPAPLILFAATCVLYLYGLGGFPLLGADEPRYAQVAREMFLRGDLVTPTLGGLHWFEKPPLLYWLMMAAYGLLGFTELAARLGPACAGLLTLFVVWRLARRVEKKSGGSEGTGETAAAGGASVDEASADDRLSCGFGFTAAAVLASSGGMMVFSRGASFDIILTATLTVALACFLGSEIEAEGRRRRLLLAGFYAGVGLSLLAKGLVGIILPGGIVAAYFLMRRRWPGLRRTGLWWGAALTVALAAVWYAPAVYRHGWEFIDKFIVQHHFARYVSNKYQHPQPFYFYLGIMALFTLPWTFFLGGALWDSRRARVSEESAHAKLHAFALAWLVVPVVFFSFSGSKLPGYVLPALPGAALLAAMRVNDYLRGRVGVGLMRATGLTALVLAAAGLTYAQKSGALSTASALALAAPALAAGGVALLLAGRRRLCVVALVAGAFLTVVLITALALGQLAGRESVRALVERADAEGLAGVPIFELHGVERTIEFYGAGRLAYAPDGQPLKLEGPSEVFMAARGGGGHALVLVPREFAYQLDKLEGAETRLIGDNGAYAMYYVVIREL